MAAKPNFDANRSGSFRVSGRDYDRMMKTLDNPPKASNSLRDFVSRGKALLNESSKK